MEQLQEQHSASCGDLERLAAAAATVGYSSDSLTFAAPAIEVDDVSRLADGSPLSSNAQFSIANFNSERAPVPANRFGHYHQKMFIDSSLPDQSGSEAIVTDDCAKTKTINLCGKIVGGNGNKDIAYPNLIQAKTINLSSDIQFLDARQTNVLMQNLNMKSDSIEVTSRDVESAAQQILYVQENLNKDGFLQPAEKEVSIVDRSHSSNLSEETACSSNSQIQNVKIMHEIPLPRLIDGIKYYCCPLCSDKFKKEYLIKRHLIIHSGEKRGSLSLETKVEIIKRIQAGEKQVDLANEYNVGRSTLSSLSKNSQKILDVFKDGKFHPESKRMKGARREDVETVLFEWYQQATQMGMVISGPILCKKAKDFAAKLGNGDFKATHGWLDRFKRRKKIVLSRGKSSNDRESKDDINDSKGDFTEHVLPSLLIDYQANDIFYASELGLFYDILPKEAEHFKGKRCAGGVSSKHRITVLLCTNMTGGERFPLLVIGRNPKPRCFKHVKSLPVRYLTNSKAWMTSEHFCSWLVDLDLWFVQQNRKVLLVVPNMPIHMKLPKLNGVKIVPSPVSFLGPSKLGIIHSLKKNYRRMLLHSYINILESQELTNNKRRHRKCKYHFDLLSCLHKLSSAWLAVSQSTITNSFQKSGLGKYGLWSINTSTDNTLGTENLDLLYKLTTFGIRIPEGFNFEDYISFDDDVQVCYLMDDDDIIASVNGCESSSSEPEVSDEEVDPLDVSERIPVGPQFSQVESSLNVIKNYISCHQASEEVYRVISHLEYLLSKAN